MRVVPIMVVLFILPTVMGDGGGINSEHIDGTPIESLSYPDSFTALSEESGDMSMELKLEWMKTLVRFNGSLKSA